MYDQTPEELEELKSFLSLIDDHFSKEQVRKLNEISNSVVSSFLESTRRNENPEMSVAKILNLIRSHSYDSPERLQNLSNHLIAIGDQKDAN